jgi:hypothetical protein
MASTAAWSADMCLWAPLGCQGDTLPDICPDYATDEEAQVLAESGCTAAAFHYGAAEVPDEVTLTADTMERLMADPELMAGVDAASKEGGTAGLITFLDAHGLRWRAGGSDPMTALADAAAHGGLAFGGPLFESGGPEFGGAGGLGSTQGTTGDRRKAARKVQRGARRANRRRR